ncbi:MAG: hypothetical protein U9N34_00110, partial [Candidatus Cloacimonadota bacterium]|nr:hypothetical protein [Candidatus Cloacimonadota bacterium]
MKKKSNIYLLILTLITVHISAIPIGEVVVIDIPWILDANDDCSILVGGGAGGQFWTEETGVVTISSTSEAAAISENGIIAGTEVEEDEATACWWDIDILEPNFLGSVQADQTNTANAINNDGSVIAGLQWYSGGMGSAKAYKWTPESGSVLLPDVLNWSSSRVDCITPDGSLIGGYAAQERSIWRPVLWNETEIIELPYIMDTFSVVSSISPNGEW